MYESPSAKDARKVCFLSGSASAREIMADVREALVRLDVAVRTSDEISVGSKITESLIDAISSADFVCIAISAIEPSLAVMYEAGLATGMQRPLLVVVDTRAAGELPAQLISAPVIRYRAGSGKSLQENLTAYVKQVQPIAAQRTLREENVVAVPPLPDRGSSSLRGSTFEQRVAARLARAGAIVSLEERKPGERRQGGMYPDIVATFPALSLEFSPVIIEVKSRRQRDIGASVEQLRNYLKSSGARLGLIVDESSEQDSSVFIVDGIGILFISADDLDLWDNDRLLEELTRLRNRVVHSV
jgi:hypothetical protein